MISLILVASIAQAGWKDKWHDFCERHIIADDPYQYEDVPSAWIERQIWVLEMKRERTRAENNQLRILKNELRARE